MFGAVLLPAHSSVTALMELCLTPSERPRLKAVTALELVSSCCFAHLHGQLVQSCFGKSRVGKGA